MNLSLGTYRVNLIVQLTMALSHAIEQIGVDSEHLILIGSAAIALAYDPDYCWRDLDFMVTESVFEQVRANRSATSPSSTMVETSVRYQRQTVTLENQRKVDLYTRTSDGSSFEKLIDFSEARFLPCGRLLLVCSLRQILTMMQQSGRVLPTRLLNIASPNGDYSST